MNWTPLGPRAALVDFAATDSEETRARARAIQRRLEVGETPDLVDFTIAFDKVLLEFRRAVNVTEWVAMLAALQPLPATKTRRHEIPVRYEGPDLEDLAGRCGLSKAEVIARHSAPVYDVAMLGFSPGFPYLEGLDSRLHAPRRANPRPRVPAGSVAIGGSHTGIYSIESPGGWHLIGRTDVRIFDPSRREPNEEAMFLLRAGDEVKFVPVE